MWLQVLVDWVLQWVSGKMIRCFLSCKTASEHRLSIEMLIERVMKILKIEIIFVYIYIYIIHVQFVRENEQSTSYDLCRHQRGHISDELLAT